MPDIFCAGVRETEVREGERKPVLLRRWSEPLRQSEIEGEPRRSPVEGERGREKERGSDVSRQRREKLLFFFDIFCFLLQRG